MLGKDIDAEAINDDVLDRCLDKLYGVGVSELYEGLASKVVNHLGLSCETVHQDATSIHVDGDYESDEDYQGIRLVRGYSRDNHIKKPQRIPALLMIMTCCLMVYAALEHLIRTRLKQKNETVHDMNNKPTNTPMAGWIFYRFMGIQELNNDQRILIINLKPMHKTILRCLGSCFQKIYS